MNVLLVGAGWVAEIVYVPFLTLLDKVKNVYIFDIDAEATNHRFKQYQNVTIVTKEDLINLNYNFVLILTPNYMHYENIMTYLNAGVKVLVEKPICINANEYNNLKNSVFYKNSELYTSSPLRYRNDIQEIKKIVESGILGYVYRVEINWFKRRGTPGSAWFTQKEYSGGGVLIDMGPHLLDLFYWFFGKKNINCSLGSINNFFLKSGDAYADWHKEREGQVISNVEDSLFSLLVYNDMSLSLNLAWASNIENDFAEIKMLGTKSSLNVRTSLGFSTNALYKDSHITISANSKSETRVLKIEDRKEPFRKMLSDLILNDTPDLPDAESALHVMNNIFNIYNHSQPIK